VSDDLRERVLAAIRLGLSGSDSLNAKKGCYGVTRLKSLEDPLLHKHPAVTPKSLAESTLYHRNTGIPHLEVAREKNSLLTPLTATSETPPDDPLTAGLWTLETCPAYVPEPRWRQAIRDGQAFLDQWRDQALGLGWQPADLFGLHQPPANPHPSYSRLSRYDQTGLCWLLDGAQVTALSSTTAVIRTLSGAILKYRRTI
jgi:hypothetical protein